MKSLTRRETLQGLGVIGVGTLLSACGGSGSGDAAATPTLAPSATSIPPGSPTRTASAAATSTATAAQATPSAVSTPRAAATPRPWSSASVEH